MFPNMLPKVHKSAVCLIPPRSAWTQIQEIRCFRDKSFVRWPPHVNLLYPFWEDRDDAFDVAAQRCSEALRNFERFEVNLNSLNFFEHGKSCTLWAQPESEALLTLQAALVRAFPECHDLSEDPSRGITHFTPHLSLGQWRDRTAITAAVQQYQSSWQAVRFEAEGVAIISRQGFDDPFRIRYVIPFGGVAPRRLDLPYVATVQQQSAPPAPVQGGSSSPQQAQQGGVDFGLSPWREGVWNFAFGANMSPTKLQGARGLSPEESVPGQLPGWRLSFTHRGAMGTLVPKLPGDSTPCVHGLLHRLTHADYARLANMEHEYRPVELEVARYKGGTQRAIAFLTPEDACIREGLPPITRYLRLLQEGAHHWGLDSSYTHWLDGLPRIEGRERGEEYYCTPDGAPLPGLPKIRTGSERQRGRGGMGRGRGRGRGGGRRGAGGSEGRGGSGREYPPA